MKTVLLDENIAISVGKYLNTLKVDVKHVNDIFKGIKDPELFDYVIKNNMILMTHDRGLVKRFEKVKEHSGVIYISKMGGQASKDIISKAYKELFFNKSNLDNMIVKLNLRDYEIMRCRRAWLGYEVKKHFYKK